MWQPHLWQAQLKNCFYSTFREMENIETEEKKFDSL